MKKNTDIDTDDELRPEYDLSELLKHGVRGKYAKKYNTDNNLVVLAPDVAGEFPDDNSVNEALRLVIRISKFPAKNKEKISVSE